jgi:hypothetical protein
VVSDDYSIVLELNFRNAVSAMHYKLWDTSVTAKTDKIPGESSNLQGNPKQLFNRQRSLLNTRERFQGCKA